MEDNKKLLETLVDRITDYGKTSYELVKLQAVDKSSDIISSIIPPAFVLILIASFLLFFNLGLAFWLGEILGKIFYGFFIVAGFYILVGIVMHYFLHKQIKEIIRNSVIKHLLK